MELIPSPSPTAFEVMILLDLLSLLLNSSLHLSFPTTSLFSPDKTALSSHYFSRSLSYLRKMSLLPL